MNRSMKASTLIETIVATIIIVLSFMALMAMTVQIRKRALGYGQHADMRACRDSVVTALADGNAVPDVIERNWGTIYVEPDDGTVCVHTRLLSGQSFMIYYFIGNGKNTEN